jgi:hypothetical protein
MDILKANNGNETQYIVNRHVYVKVWDYNKKFLLSHLKLSMTETIWVWIGLNEGTITEIGELSHATFEDAINKAVNNPYATVYGFDSYEEMAIHWEDIKYIDTITTTYKAKK